MPTTGPAAAAIRAIGIPMAVVLLALLWILWNSELFGVSPLNTHLGYNYPVYATADADGNLYVVDTSRRRVTRRTPEGRIDLELRGGQRTPGEFFYAEDVTVDSAGNIYLLNVVTDLNGYYLEREEVLRFDPDGRFTDVVYRREYDGPEHRIPPLVQRGRISSLYTEDDEVGWFVVDATGIVPYRYAAGEVLSGKRYDWADADMHFADVAPFYGPGRGFVYSDKNGRIVHVAESSRERVLYRAPQTELDIVPWEVESYGDGRVAFVDLGHRALRGILPVAVSPADEPSDASRSEPERPGVILDQSIIQAAGHDTSVFNYYRIDAPQPDTLVTTNDEAVVSLTAGTGALDYFTGGTRALDWVVSVWLTWFAVVLACGAFLLALYRFYVHVFERSVPLVLVKSLAIVAVVATSATIVASIIIPDLTSRSQNILLEKIGSMQDTIPHMVDGDLFTEIEGLSDYDGPAYRDIREQFLKALNYNRDPWNESFYFALYRLIDGRLYGFMFLNGEIGMYHPYDWIGYGGVYDKALEGEVAIESVTDIAGDWMYGVSPIYDDNGDIVALFETGTDLYAFNMSTRLLIEEIIYQVITILVILIILMIEFAVFADMLRNRRASLRAYGDGGGRLEDAGVQPVPGYSDVMLTRVPCFLLFSAVMLSLSYMPLLAQDFYTPIAGLSKEMVIALPISAEMLFFGIGTIVAGSIGSRLGWRVAANAGMMVVIVGLLSSGLARDIQALIIARGLVGFGTGMAYIGLRLLINGEAGRDERSHGFRHLYAGMTAGTIAGVVLGGTMAERIGYGPTFFVGIALIALAFGFYLLNLRSAPAMRPRDREDAGTSVQVRDLARYFSSGRVWAFLLLLMIPTYIAGTFVAYYFPLFAESKGLDSDDIARWMVVNGLFIVYLGPPLARALQHAMGPTRTAVLGSFVWGAALVVFALTGSLVGAVATLIIMGIAEGFCAPAQNDAYLELDACRHIGEDRAVGYFELFGKLGETIGPIAFAAALLLGSVAGPLTLGLVIMLLAAPYLLSGARNYTMAEGRAV